MGAPVDALEQRVRDPQDPLEEVLPASITLSLMLRNRRMGSWLQNEFAGYSEDADLPDYRQNLPGHLMTRSPQYGWIPAPVSEEQNRREAHMDLRDGVRSLEKTCLRYRKDSYIQHALSAEAMRELQTRVNLTTDLALTINRETYSDLLRLVRSTIYLWTLDLIEAGFSGEHNSFSTAEREQAATMDDPEHYWRRAMDEHANLPVPGLRQAGVLERFFGSA
ncbi:hypothetical protein CK501_09900 [Halovibrio salipaludis]|uniref:AbiTii domain-containing protein n=1 Tax=Halovibrio salipaludis TaxID=2032626 RepID=A0A2A2F7K6_9GAMM|nr:hypothetical protein [Halovibrio salipaludis]PAU80714.1 hypothetical protein CK501_09900 [Halovibrio salipaludis]